MSELMAALCEPNEQPWYSAAEGGAQLPFTEAPPLIDGDDSDDLPPAQRRRTAPDEDGTELIACGTVAEFAQPDAAIDDRAVYQIPGANIGRAAHSHICALLGRLQSQLAAEYRQLVQDTTEIPTALASAIAAWRLRRFVEDCDHAELTGDLGRIYRAGATPTYHTVSGAPRALREYLQAEVRAALVARLRLVPCLARADAIAQYRFPPDMRCNKPGCGAPLDLAFTQNGACAAAAAAGQPACDCPYSVRCVSCFVIDASEHIAQQAAVFTEKHCCVECPWCHRARCTYACVLVDAYPELPAKPPPASKTKKTQSHHRATPAPPPPQHPPPQPVGVAVAQATPTPPRYGLPKPLSCV
ncbi:MAG: hypothetical protein M0R22_07940 [Dehalococcoidia bacterium]|jgi:hypothetical protein|nr:hypothetical protein [Dehalococcoidia bacterium]